MRLFKLLLKKCFREILRNIKQYISIIFIIAISVTLYTGLDANALGLKNRVEDVYVKGNIADEWVTLNPQFGEYEKMDEDYEQIKKASGDNSTIEKRFYMQSTINSTTLNGLISDSIPKVNAPYNTKRGEYSNNDFFFVDYAFKAKYEEYTGTTLSLNTSLPVSFDTTLICVALKKAASNEELIKTKLKEAVDKNVTNDYLKESLYTYIDENIADLQGFLIERIDNFNTNVPSIILDFTINGFMSHPENVENGEFSTGNYLLSSRLLLNSIINKVGSYINSDSIIEALNSLKENANAVTSRIIDYLLSYFDDPSTKVAFDAYVQFEIGEMEDTINGRQEPSIEDFVSHLYNQFIVKLDDNVTENEFEAKLQTYFEAKGADNNLIAVLSKESYPAIATIENEKNQATALTYCFPIIFFVVAILIVLTTISQLVLRERTQIGTLKALGVKKGIILFYYIAEMCLVGLIGTILGFIIGPLLIPNILNIKYNILYSIPSLSYTFPWISSLVLLVSVVGLIALLSYLLLRKEICNSASESMRSQTPQLKLKTFSKLKLSTSMMIALRNIRVHLLKSIMVLIGVMGCTGLLICGFGIDDVIVVGRDNDLYNFYVSDLSASVNLGTPYGKVHEEYDTYEFVNNVEEYAISTINVTYSNNSINCPLYYFSMQSDFFGYDDELKDGHWNKEGIGLSQARAEDLGVKEGDEVILTINGENKSYKVESIFYVFATAGIYIYRETIPDLIASPTHIWVDVKDGYDLNDCKEFINNNSKYTHSCRTIDDNMKKIEGYMSSIKTMTNTVKVFAILLAIVVLLNLGILNFNERIREIATLKVIGFNRISIAKSLIYEMMILVLIGSLLGLTIGLPFEIMVLSTNETAIASWNYYVSGLTYFISIIISLVTALFVTTGLSLKIKHVSMTESLKSVE